MLVHSLGITLLYSDDPPSSRPPMPKDIATPVFDTPDAIAKLVLPGQEGPVPTPTALGYARPAPHPRSL